MFILDSYPVPRVHEPIKMDLQKFEEAKWRPRRRLGPKGPKEPVPSALNCVGTPLEGTTQPKMGTNETLTKKGT